MSKYYFLDQMNWAFQNRHVGHGASLVLLDMALARKPQESLLAHYLLHTHALQARKLHGTKYKSKNKTKQLSQTLSRQKRIPLQEKFDISPWNTGMQFAMTTTTDNPLVGRSTGKSLLSNTQWQMLLLQIYISSNPSNLNIYIYIYIRHFMSPYTIHNTQLLQFSHRTSTLPEHLQWRQLFPSVHSLRHM